MSFYMLFVLYQILACYRNATPPHCPLLPLPFSTAKNESSQRNSNPIRTHDTFASAEGRFVSARKSWAKVLDWHHLGSLRSIFLPYNGSPWLVAYSATALLAAKMAWHRWAAYSRPVVPCIPWINRCLSGNASLLKNSQFEITSESPISKRGATSWFQAFFIFINTTATN